MNIPGGLRIFFLQSGQLLNKLTQLSFFKNESNK